MAIYTYTPKDDNSVLLGKIIKLIERNFENRRDIAISFSDSRKQTYPCGKLLHPGQIHFVEATCYDARQEKRHSFISFLFSTGAPLCQDDTIWFSEGDTIVFRSENQFVIKKEDGLEMTVSAG